MDTAILIIALFILMSPVYIFIAFIYTRVIWYERIIAFISQLNCVRNLYCYVDRIVSDRQSTSSDVLHNNISYRVLEIVNGMHAIYTGGSKHYNSANSALSDAIKPLVTQVSESIEQKNIPDISHLMTGFENLLAIGKGMRTDQCARHNTK
jgi:hypothetical protein